MSKTTYNEGIMIYRSRGLNLNIPSVVRFFTACYLRYAMMHCITCMWPALASNASIERNSAFSLSSNYDQTRGYQEMSVWDCVIKVASPFRPQTATTSTRIRSRNLSMSRWQWEVAAALEPSCPFGMIPPAESDACKINRIFRLWSIQIRRRGPTRRSPAPCYSRLGSVRRHRMSPVAESAETRVRHGCKFGFPSVHRLAVDDNDGSSL
jgi:hypothetical protein